jgi:uncharacterized protein (DUF58 family)
MLPKEIMRRVREIQVRTGRQVADVLAGEYVSVFKGSGIEFDEVRAYIPGDDVRSIDWNVTARMGEPFVKRYVEERQLTLMLMADISASQDFGSSERSKRECAAEFCALLAFSASRNDDKVGLLLFHSDIEQYIPPRKGQKHALRVVREVLAHGEETSPLARHEMPSAGGFWRRLLRARKRLRAPREGTAINRALEFFLSVNKRRSVCFVVSDFIDEGYEQALRSANRKHDVVAVLITDPRELDVPAVGLVTLEDMETGATRVVDAGSAAFRAAVREQADQRVEGIRKRLAGSGIDLIHIDAAGSVVDPLVRFFRARERRTRR